jgi:threonine synthase
MSNIFLSKFLSEKYGREVFVCDETKNPTGSHKDRSFGVWLEKIKNEGSAKDLVISSSGNAAASAAYFAKQFGLPLHIFVSEKIAPEKLEKIKKICHSELVSESKDGEILKQVQDDSKITIHLVARPKFEAALAAKNNGWFWLRSSVNGDALLGYESLAKEIDEINPRTVFIPSSSGTLAVGLYKFLKSKPAFHLAQTTKVNTLVKKFDKDFAPEEKSLADAIVDLIGHRQAQVEEIITNSDGFGWVIGNKEIEAAREELKEAGIECSNTSALGLAGFKKTLSKNFKLEDPIIIIVT